LFFGLSCLVNVANLAIISGYYGWDGGWRTFGSRYFIPSALLLFLALPVTLREARAQHAAVFGLVLSLFAIPTVVALNKVNAFVAGLMALAAWAVVGVHQRAADSRGILAVTAASTVILSEFCAFAVGHFSSRILKLLQPAPAEGLLLVLGFFVVLAVSLLVVLSVNTYVRHADEHSGLSWVLVPGGIAAVSLTLTLFQAMKFMEFRSATEDYRRAQIAKPDARFKFKAPFNFENFSEDVDGPEEWSDEEMKRARTFRDTIRATTALEHSHQ
jgi:hypothetical protein